MKIVTQNVISRNTHLEISSRCRHRMIVSFCMAIVFMFGAMALVIDDARTNPDTGSFTLQGSIGILYAILCVASCFSFSRELRKLRSLWRDARDVVPSKDGNSLSNEA